MDTRPRNRRKTLIVNKELQHRIIRHVTLYPLLTLLVAAVSIGIFTTRVFGEAAEANVELPSLSLIPLSVTAFVLIFGLLLIRQTLLFSNKIAGPNYRICQDLEKVRNGDLDLRINLRHDDFNTEIAEEINLLLDWIASRDKAAAAAGPEEVQMPLANQKPDTTTATATH